MLVSYCPFEQLFNLHNANRIIAGNGRTKKRAICGVASGSYRRIRGS